MITKQEALGKLFRTAEEFVGTFANVPPLELPKEEKNEFLKLNYAQLVAYRRRKSFPNLSPEERQKYDEALEMTLYTREQDRKYNREASRKKRGQGGAWCPGGGRVIRSGKPMT